MALPIHQDFAGEERAFLARIGELRKIEARCSAGIFEVAGELARCVSILRQAPNATVFDQLLLGLGALRVDYVREPILQALTAGGMSSGDATRMVVSEIDDHGFVGLLNNAPLALAVVIAGISQPVGAEAPGESRAGKAPPASTGETSTAQAPP